MSNRRISLVIGLALLGIVVGLYTVSSIVLYRGFTQLEQADTERSVKQATDALSNELAQLSDSAYGYANWDETYKFVQDGNADYPKQYLDNAAFKALNLNTVVFVNAAGQIVYSQEINPSTGKTTTVSASLRSHLTHHALLLRHPTLTTSQVGLLALPEGLLMIVSRPILTNNGKGPIQGSLLMARYLNKAEVARLGQRVQASLNIYPIDAPPNPSAFQQVRSTLFKQAILAQPLNKKQIVGYGLLKDLYGNPKLVLQVDAPRTIYQQGMASLRYLGASLLIVGLLSGWIIQQLLIKLMRYVKDRDRMEQALIQEAVLRKSEALYREKAQELEQTLQELKQTQAQLVQTEKMSSLGQLVAGVAHEINNPVNFISGNLACAERYIQDFLDLVRLYQHHYPNPVAEIVAQRQAIEADYLLEDLPQLLKSMQIGSDRIQKIVLSLRNFSRMDEAEMKRVNIHEGIDNALLLLQSRLKAKAGKSDIEVTKVYGVLPPVECYVGQLNQAIMNLLVNSIDAIESHADAQTAQSEQKPFAPCIWIYTEAVDPDQVAIHIADNGIGITKTIRQRLFDPFFTTKAVGKGTGLGLAISHQIVVEKHHGQIRCSSEPGEGAKFTIQIPIDQQ